MREMSEILAAGKIYNTRAVTFDGIQMLAGEVFDRNQRIYFTAGTDEEGWEHVAVHVGNGHRCPTWETMCLVKELFWRDDEDVIQLHPKKTEYFHGVQGMEVLHLWRPVSGDWAELNHKGGTGT